MDSSESEIAPEILDRIRAAEGWLGLGDYNSASEELDCLPAHAAIHFEVLKIRCAIYRKAKRWNDLQTLAESCCEIFPNVIAFWLDVARALDAKGQTEEAIAQLLVVKDRFPMSDAIAYYFACFLAKLDRIEEARAWLSCAFKYADNVRKLKLRALEQPELAKVFQGDC
jgi:hypothetical protein